MKKSTFADILALDEAALREKFAHGAEAVERLWAAWALGMRQLDDMPALVHDAAAREPTPGVRAHLALMLVAHGEVDAAAALARFDPEAVVRASACRHLARVAKPADALSELLAERLAADPSNDVKIAIVDGTREDATGALAARCIELLADPAEEVRAAAIDSIVRRSPPVGPFPSSLRAHVRIEPSSELRSTLLAAWTAAEGGASIVAETASWEAHHVVRVLDLAREEEVVLAPAVLELLFARAEPEIAASLADLAEEKRFDAPLPWLGDVVMRAVDREAVASVTSWVAATTAMRVLADQLDGVAHASLSRAELETVGRLREVFEREAKRLAEDAKVGIDTCVEWLRGQDIEEAALARLHDVEWQAEMPELVACGIALLPTLIRLDVPMN